MVDPHFRDVVMSLMGGHCREMVKARLHHGDLLRQDRPELHSVKSSVQNGNQY